MPHPHFQSGYFGIYDDIRDLWDKGLSMTILVNYPFALVLNALRVGIHEHHLVKIETWLSQNSF